MATTRTEEIIENLLKLMNVSFDAIERVENLEADHTRFHIQSKESPILIGAKGEHLDALNYLVRRIVAKASGDEAPAKFIVDVNGYHERALETLKAKAKVMSDRAISFKVDVELEPMSSYERMHVHSFLAGQPNIKTESKGEGSSRRLVIKYISN